MKLVFFVFVFLIWKDITTITTDEFAIHTLVLIYRMSQQKPRLEFEKISYYNSGLDIHKIFLNALEQIFFIHPLLRLNLNHFS